ncbi:MAG: ABC transporter substrate-binding protein [Desulfobulbaceae bacterium]|nr:ABC transporter substrate-binding protein [Desulfobulbaceae bacterium]
MNKKIAGWIVTAAIVAVIVAVVVYREVGAPKPDSSISIGAILPMTGNLAVLGQNEARLLQATEDVINEKRSNGSKIKIMIEDAAFDAKKAASIANLFVSKDVPIIMISTTPLAAPVVPIAEQSGRLSVIHSMTEALLNDTRLALRIYPGIDDEVRTIGQWLRQQNEPTSISVLRLDADWSAKWVDQFRAAYPDIPLQDETYTMQEINVRDALAKVRAANLSHILLLGYGQEYPSILRQIKEAQIDVPIVGNIGFAYAGTKEAAAGAQSQELLTGCLFPFLALDLKSKDFVTLNSKYREKFNADPLQEPGALYFFDTVKLILNAVDAVGVDPAKIKANILTEQNPYHGITGEITFSPNGNTTVALRMARYDKNGEIEFLKP